MARPRGQPSPTGLAPLSPAPTQVAANIAAAINLNTTLQTATGVSATSSGNTVLVTANTPGTAGNSYGTTKTNFTGFAWGAGTLSGGIAGAVVQPNMYPAKYSFSATTASCSDFVVYPMGTAGATGAARLSRSPIFIRAGARARCRLSIGPITRAAWSLLLLCPPWMAHKWRSFRSAALPQAWFCLKWSANSGTPTLPVTPAAATLATYRGCTAPCMVTLAFSGNHERHVLCAVL